MQAIAIEGFGGRDRLHLMELDDPLVGPDTVLIENRATSVNPVDWKIREGRLAGAYPHAFPLIPGWDAAGVVRAVGPAVTAFEPGDEVYAYCRKDFVRDGTSADLVSMRDAAVARKPQATSFVEAGALPLAGLTALQAIRILGVGRRDTVLVHAGAGGVGHLAIQLAKAAGARVIATAGPDNLDFVRELGADEAIDYRAGDVAGAVLERHPDGIDAVLDVFGGEAQAEAARYLARGRGRLVSIAAPPDDPAFAERDIDVRYLFVRPDAAGLATLAAAVDAGRLRVHVSEIVPLADTARAHELVEGGHTRGKVAISIG